jgi:hypothetical protein
VARESRQPVCWPAALVPLDRALNVAGVLAQPQLIIEGIFFSDFKGKLASTRFLSDRRGASLSSPGAIEDLRTPDAGASRGVELRGFREVGIAALVVDP